MVTPCPERALRPGHQRSIAVCHYGLIRLDDRSGGIPWLELRMCGFDSRGPLQVGMAPGAGNGREGPEMRCSGRGR